MGIIGWIIFGILTGALAKYLMIGRQQDGLLSSIAFGIAGAVLSGYIGTLFGLGTIYTFSVPSLLLAIGGASVSSLGFQLFAEKAVA